MSRRAAVLPRLRRAVLCGLGNGAIGAFVALTYHAYLDLYLVTHPWGCVVMTALCGGLLVMCLDKAQRGVGWWEPWPVERAR